MAYSPGLAAVVASAVDAPGGFCLHYSGTVLGEDHLQATPSVLPTNV